MQKLKAFTAAWSLVFAALGVATITLLLIALPGNQGNGNYVLAGVFWLAFLVEIISFRKCTAERIKYEQKHGIHHHQKLPNGLITFASNLEALIADIALLISVVSLAIVTFFKFGSNGFTLLIIAMTFLSMNLHCILNSRNYRYYKWNKKAIRKGVRKHE